GPRPAGEAGQGHLPRVAEEESGPRRERPGGGQHRPRQRDGGAPRADVPPGAGDERLPDTGRPTVTHERTATCSPSRPCGRKVSTTTSTTKAHTSFQSDPRGRYSVASASTIPITNPPSTAPRMLPIPPSTAAVKALMPARNPMWKSMAVKRTPWITPATPASAPPS